MQKWKNKSDDILLLSPSRFGSSIIICESWAAKYGVIFSTDPNPHKSVGLEKKKRKHLEPLTLDGRKLPFVSSIKHVGHIITETGDMEEDARIRRGIFLGKLMETSIHFHNAHPRFTVVTFTEATFGISMGLKLIKSTERGVGPSVMHTDFRWNATPSSQIVWRWRCTLRRWRSCPERQRNLLPSYSSDQ